MLPAVQKALAQERDREVKEALRATAAQLALASPDPGQRLAAIEELRKAHAKRRLLQQREVEKDPTVLAASMTPSGRWISRWSAAMVGSSSPG